MACSCMGGVVRNYLRISLSAVGDCWPNQAYECTSLDSSSCQHSRCALHDLRTVGRVAAAAVDPPLQIVLPPTRTKLRISSCRNTEHQLRMIRTVDAWPVAAR